MTRMSKLLGAAAIGALLAFGFGTEAEAAKDQLIVDLVNEPSSLDPHVQWNPDSYYVYRNMFDNLVTRDDAGKIIPQVATHGASCRHADRVHSCATTSSSMTARS